MKDFITIDEFKHDTKKTNLNQLLLKSPESLLAIKKFSELKKLIESSDLVKNKVTKALQPSSHDGKEKFWPMHTIDIIANFAIIQKESVYELKNDQEKFLKENFEINLSINSSEQLRIKHKSHDITIKLSEINWSIETDKFIDSMLFDSASSLIIYYNSLDLDYDLTTSFQSFLNIIANSKVWIGRGDIILNIYQAFCLTLDPKDNELLIKALDKKIVDKIYNYKSESVAFIHNIIKESISVSSKEHNDKLIEALDQLSTDQKNEKIQNSHYSLKALRSNKLSEVAQSYKKILELGELEIFEKDYFLQELYYLAIHNKTAKFAEIITIFKDTQYSNILNYHARFEKYSTLDEQDFGQPIKVQLALNDIKDFCLADQPFILTRFSLKFKNQLNKYDQKILTEEINNHINKSNTFNNFYFSALSNDFNDNSLDQIINSQLIDNNRKGELLYALAIEIMQNLQAKPEGTILELALKYLNLAVQQHVDVHAKKIEDYKNKIHNSLKLVETKEYAEEYVKNLFSKITNIYQKNTELLITKSETSYDPSPMPTVFFEHDDASSFEESKEVNLILGEKFENTYKRIHTNHKLQKRAKEVYKIIHKICVINKDLYGWQINEKEFINIENAVLLDPKQKLYAIIDKSKHTPELTDQYNRALTNGLTNIKNGANGVKSINQSYELKVAKIDKRLFPSKIFNNGNDKLIVFNKETKHSTINKQLKTEMINCKGLIEYDSVEYQKFNSKEYDINCIGNQEFGLDE